MENNKKLLTALLAIAIVVLSVVLVFSIKAVSDTNAKIALERKQLDAANKRVVELQVIAAELPKYEEIYNQAITMIPVGAGRTICSIWWANGKGERSTLSDLRLSAGVQLGSVMEMPMNASLSATISR
jgi:hypothetical protein